MITVSDVSLVLEGRTILDHLSSLLDKSLIRMEENREGEIRFHMLETIREYALERLNRSGEMASSTASYIRFTFGMPMMSSPAAFPSSSPYSEIFATQMKS